MPNTVLTTYHLCIFDELRYKFAICTVLPHSAWNVPVLKINFSHPYHLFYGKCILKKKL